MRQDHKNISGFVAFLIFFFLCVPCAFADLTINLIAVNASEDKVREIEVKHYLPEELKLDDIFDSEPLQIDYDVDKDVYFVKGMVTFQPKESKTFKIRVKDVWKITVMEIDSLKGQLDEHLHLLEQEKDYENYDRAKAARDRIFQKLDRVLTQQQNYSEDIARRIEEYRAYANVLKQLRGDIYDPNFLRNEAIIGTADDADKTVTLVISARNSSETKEKTVRYKHYLPKEVRSRHLVEKFDFDVRFDEKTGRAFLTKEEIFLPGEEKRYKILIQDIWSIPPSKLDILKDRAEIVIMEIRDSIYANTGMFLFERSTKVLQQIRDLQAQSVSIKKHIGIFRRNEKRYENAENDVRRLEEIMLLVKAKKLEEFEKRKVKNILKKLQALRGLSDISEALFKKGVSVDTTWRVIMMTLAFVFFLTGVHFFRWSSRSAKMGEEKSGEGVTEVPKPGVEEKPEE